jgi:hypothetical protein
VGEISLKGLQKISAFFLLGALGSEIAHAQSTSPTDADTVLCPSPFVSTRAAGMGGALSTLAEGLDALYYNPAGIGGLRSDPRTNSLFFPYVGASLNENAGSVRNQFNASQAQRDSSTGAAIIDANEGNRQYARGSIIPIGLLLGRTALVPVLDSQLAAVPNGQNSGQVKLRYRAFTGAMIGTSIADNGNRFSLGISQSVGTIEETMGTYNYVDMVDSYQRKKILRENRNIYAASAANAGMVVRIPKGITPTFSLVARNIGNTKNIAKADGVDPLVFDEDLTAGFSISPRVGKIGVFNLLLESGYLTQKHMAARKKVRGGMELLLGGHNGKSLFGVRAGGNDAGWSAGLHINLGLIGVEVESHAIDIGLNNDRIIERRGSGVVYIDLASF